MPTNICREHGVEPAAMGGYMVDYPDGSRSFVCYGCIAQLQRRGKLIITYQEKRRKGQEHGQRLT